MSDLGFHGLPKWIKHLRAHDILCTIIGVEKSNVPGLGTHYDFMTRFWGVSPETEKKSLDSLHPFTSKPRKKLGKNEKLPPKHPGVIKNLVEQALKGRSIETRPEKLFQQIFAKLAVESSAKLGLLGDTHKINISGDGTCLETGGRSFGIKTCDCIKKGIFNCKCNRLFSDPDAKRGWHSYPKSGTTVIAYIFLVYITLNLKRIFLYILGWYKRSVMMVLLQYLHYQKLERCILYSTSISS